VSSEKGGDRDDTVYLRNRRMTVWLAVIRVEARRIMTENRNSGSSELSADNTRTIAKIKYIYNFIFLSF